MARNNDKTAATDAIVGANIQTLRIACGWSRQQLAERIDVTHQMLSKYEKATNRITSGRLELIAKVFYKPVGYFFDEENIVECPRVRLMIEIFRELNKKTDQKNEAVLLIARAL